MIFQAWNKIARISRDMVITEKLDGTNACIYIGEDGEFGCQSRTRVITPEGDNMGFAKWAYSHKEELQALGPGYHFGEWWGCNIQRNYGLKEKRFSLFNVGRWNTENIPSCVSVVPTLYIGMFDTDQIQYILDLLNESGSIAAPGFMKPEGVVVYHTGNGYLFKKTFEKDEKGKGE